MKGKKWAALCALGLLLCPPATAEPDLALAQQIVNAEYYLSLGEEAPAPDVTLEASAPLADDPALLDYAAPAEDLPFAQLPVAAALADVNPRPNFGEDGSGDFFLGNPPQSGICLVADLRAPSGELLLRTGAVPPGKMLKGVGLSAEALALLDGETASLTVYAYDPQTFVSLGAATVEIEVRRAGGA